MYGVNLEEAAHSLEHYNSLCEFFIRQLKEGTRPVAETEPLVSILGAEICSTKNYCLLEKHETGSESERSDKIRTCSKICIEKSKYFVLNVSPYSRMLIV